MKIWELVGLAWMGNDWLGLDGLCVIIYASKHLF